MASSFSPPILRTLIFGWMFVGLYGCGGGGDSGDSNSTDPTLSLDQNSLTFTENTANQPATQTVRVRIRNVPAEGYYYRYRWQGTAIANVTWGQESDGATLGVTPITPNILGAGAYVDTIRVEICFDSSCTKQFANSPAEIQVTYTVTGDSRPIATFSLDHQSLEVESRSDGSLVSSQVVQYVSNRPPYDVGFAIGRRTNSVVNDVHFLSLTDSSAQWTLDMKAKNVLGAGFFKESLSFSLCFDSTCTNRSSDSPQSISLTYNVLAEQGSDFTSHTVTGAASDIAFDAVSGKIYAAFGAPLLEPGTFSRIDPLTGAVEATVTLPGRQPTKLALSDDGQFAFVIFTDSSNGFVQAIAQIALSTMSVVDRIDMEVPTNWAYIDAIAIAPATADRLAVIVRNANFSGIEVYQGGTKAGALALSSNASSSITWADSTKLYYYSESSDTLYQATFTGSTLPVIDSLTGFTSGCPSYICREGSIYYRSGHIYNDFGVVYDVATNAVVDQLPVRGNAANTFVAVSDTHAYFVYSGVGLRITSFDLARGEPIVEARLPEGIGLSQVRNGRLITWGTDGLAFVSGNGVVIVRGSFVTQSYNANWNSAIQSAPDKVLTRAAMPSINVH